MKRCLTGMIITLLLLAAGLEAQAGQSGALAGARYRVKHSTFFEDIPYGNGDISYFAGYEFTDGVASWQLTLDYAPDISGKKTNPVEGGDPLSVDYILTPAMLLLFTDRYFRGGGGVFTSYVRDEEGGDWQGPCGQLQVGLHFPMGKLSLDLSTYYIFTDFSDFGEFDFGDLEYGGWFTYIF